MLVKSVTGAVLAGGGGLSDLTTLETSKLETANGVGEFVQMDQGDTMPARASPGKSGTTSEFPEDNGEGKGGDKCKGLGEAQDGDTSTREIREGDRVCRGEQGSGISEGETRPGWAISWPG